MEWAEFIGSNGSMGLNKGQQYLVKIRQSFLDEGYVLIVDHTKRIPYDTITAITKNWKFIGR